MHRTSLIVALVIQTCLALPGAAEDRTIHSGVAEFELRECDIVAGIAGDEPFVVQFREVPDATLRDSLRSRGVTLDTYVGGNAYIARCEPACVAWLPYDAAVRASVRLSPEMKHSRVFLTDAGLASRIREGLSLKVDLSFFEGTSFTRAMEILTAHEVDVRQSTFGSRSSVTVEITWHKALELLECKEVRWIDPALPEAIPETINAGERTRVDQVREQYEFDGADGSGVKVGVWDWFPETSHADLEDRVTWVNVIRGQLSHGQLVSGIIAGAGLIDHHAKGMAPKAELYWHTTERSTAWSDMSAMQATYGITITNNSWGVMVGWWAEPGATVASWEDNEWAWGYYHELAAGADDLVRDNDLLVVFAAGNSRGYGWLGPHLHSGVPGPDVRHEDVHSPNPQYGSVFGPAVAKNVLSVGYVSKDEVVTLRSVWGPTDDGRIKPDVVAPGLDLFVTDENDGYTMASGSSLSSPVVAGSAALLTDYWRRRQHATPSSLELKNLMIHSARDLGNPGPDYAYGFGLIDVELAARIIDAASFVPLEESMPPSPQERRRGVRRGEGSPQPQYLPAMVLSGDLDNGVVKSVRFVVRDQSPTLRATLAWHDHAGDQLVNDLDLWLISPDLTVVRPFVLDPSNPSGVAVRARNVVDNVESVVVQNPAAGVWTVVAAGTRIALAPQRFSLIVSAVAENVPLEVRAEGRCEIFSFFPTKDDETDNPITPATRFHAGDPLNVYFSFGIPENADYGDYYGSISLVGSVTNAQGDVVVAMQNDTHQVPPVERLDIVGTGFFIPNALPSGAYELHLSLNLRNGQECTDHYGFTVE